MTRINLIDPTCLSYRHLLAEYKEITRVFALAHQAGQRGSWKAPASYTMGGGHIKFFYDKLNWIAKRHAFLRMELIERGVKPKINRPETRWRRSIPDNQWNGWEPTRAEITISLQRLTEREPEHYEGKEKYIADVSCGAVRWHDPKHFFAHYWNESYGA